MDQYFVDFKTFDGAILHYGAPSVAELIAKVLANPPPKNYAWLYPYRRG